MTRFVYLSDTHCGIETPGYSMQASQPSRLPELLAALEAWMDAHGPVDFVPVSYTHLTLPTIYSV